MSDPSIRLSSTHDDDIAKLRDTATCMHLLSVTVRHRTVMTTLLISFIIEPCLCALIMVSSRVFLVFFGLCSVSIPRPVTITFRKILPKPYHIPCIGQLISLKSNKYIDEKKYIILCHSKNRPTF
jgi:hypothetical protein